MQTLLKATHSVGCDSQVQLGVLVVAWFSSLV